MPRWIARNPGRSVVLLLLLLLIAAGGSVAGVWLWASYHLRVGREMLERYHVAEAVPHLQIALSIWPRDPETLLLAARAARRNGSLDEADQFLDRYQQVRGDDESLLLERVCLRAERGDPESVHNYCESLLAADHPAAPLVLEALVRGFLKAFQPRAAEHFLDDWMRRQPDNPEALLLKGQVYDLQLHFADAVKSYRAALTIDANFDEARLHLCEALIQLNSFEEVRPHLDYLRRRLPGNLAVRVYLARSEAWNGHPEEAERMLDEVLEANPSYAPALAERGKLAWRAGDAVAAEKWLRQAVERFPGDYQACYHLFLCLERNGKRTEAQQMQERAERMQKDMDLIQDVVQRMSSRPHDPELHYQLGILSLRAGSIPEGLRWLHSALKEDPNHQPTHQALMEYYQRIGDSRRAREHRQHLTGSS